MHGHTTAFKRHNVREDRSNSKNILRVPIINAVSASAGRYLEKGFGNPQLDWISELEKGKSVAD